MEAVALASTFATLIGFAMQLYGNCKYYIDAARGDCPSDLKLILIETSSLRATLEAVRDILALSDTPEQDERRLKAQIAKPIADCGQCIDELLKLVPKPMLNRATGAGAGGELRKRDKAAIVVQALAWGTGGKKGRCDMLLQHLRAHKATLNLGLTTELSSDIKRVTAAVTEVRTTVNTMQTKLDEAQRAKIYHWLEQTNPSSNHNHASALHSPGTGAWLTATPEWTAWLTPPSSNPPNKRLLWIHGIPGAGKTVLAYSIINTIRHSLSSSSRAAAGLAYYYCYHARSRDETVPFLTWVLSQLCRAAEFIPRQLADAYGSGCEPTVGELLDCLEAVVGRFAGGVYVVVDAVDESAPRAGLVKVLGVLATEGRFKGVRLAVTSREYQDIEAVLGPRGVGLSMANGGVGDDIRRFVVGRLEEEGFKAWGSELRGKVADVLPVKARGMFRYAACQLEILEECSSVSEVHRELARLPATLDETYERILRNIDAKHRGDAIRALALVMGSVEHTGPILASTLVSAVVNHGAGGGGTQSFCTIDTLRRHCLCLIKVRADKTVDVAHYTVREYLQGPRVKAALPEFALTPKTAEAMYVSTVMAAATQFTGTPSIAGIPEDRNGDPVDYRLYALRRTRVAMFWNRDTLCSTAELRRLAITLVNPYAPCFRGLQLLGSDGHADSSNESVFEWLPKFNGSADATEKAAAHLAMLATYERPELIREFLASKSEQQKAALFAAEFKVILPAQWKLFRQHGTYDGKATAVTVLGYYQEGSKREYDTSDKIKLLRGAFGQYLPKESKPAVSANSSAQMSQPRAQPQAHSQQISPPVRQQAQQTQQNQGVKQIQTQGQGQNQTSAQPQTPGPGIKSQPTGPGIKASVSSMKIQTQGLKNNTEIQGSGTKTQSPMTSTTSRSTSGVGGAVGANNSRPVQNTSGPPSNAGSTR